MPYLKQPAKMKKPQLFFPHKNRHKRYKASQTADGSICGAVEPHQSCWKPTTMAMFSFGGGGAQPEIQWLWMDDGNR